MTVTELYHYGIKGQKWGFRRFQNIDGSLTSAGRARYLRGRSSSGIYKGHGGAISGYLSPAINKYSDRVSNLYESVGYKGSGAYSQNINSEKMKKSARYVTPRLYSTRNYPNKYNSPISTENQSPSSKGVSNNSQNVNEHKDDRFVFTVGKDGRTVLLPMSTHRSSGTESVVRDIQRGIQQYINNAANTGSEFLRRANNAQQLISNFVRDLNNPPVGAGFDEGYSVGSEFGRNFVNNLFGLYRK